MNNSEKYTQAMQHLTSTNEGQDNSEKTAKYTDADWALIREKADKIHKRLVANMNKGAAAPEVQDLIAELRQHITDDVCSCTPEILRQIADLYVFDKRFTVKVDNYQAGFSAFLREAIYIYCDNLERVQKEYPEEFTARIF